MVLQSTRLQGHITNVVSGLTKIVTLSGTFSERQLNASCEGISISSTALLLGRVFASRLVGARIRPSLRGRAMSAAFATVSFELASAQHVQAKDREYELLERRPEGSLNWRGVVHGLGQARVRVHFICRRNRSRVLRHVHAAE